LGKSLSGAKYAQMQQESAEFQNKRMQSCEWFTFLLVSVNILFYRNIINPELTLYKCISSGRGKLETGFKAESHANLCISKHKVKHSGIFKCFD